MRPGGRLKPHFGNAPRHLDVKQFDGTSRFVSNMVILIYNMVILSYFISYRCYLYGYLYDLYVIYLVSCLWLLYGIFDVI